MVAEGRIAVKNRERVLACLLDPVTVAPQRCQFEVASTLLPFAHDRAFAPQLKIDLGKFEAVGRVDKGLEARHRDLGCATGHQITERLVGATTDTTP